MTKTLYILLIAVVFGLVSCADEHAADQGAPSQLRFSLAIADSEAGTRTTPGDPGYREWPFVKPKHLYAIAILTYNDSKTFLTYRHIDTSQPDDWSDLHKATENEIAEGSGTYIPTGDSISTYNKGSLSLRSTTANVTAGKFYALATLAPITLAGIGVTEEDRPTELSPSLVGANDAATAANIETYIKSLTFSLPDKATLEAAAASAGSVLGVRDSEPSPQSVFFRSAYNTPSAGYNIAALPEEVKTVTATLYHTATRLDIQWDTEALKESSYSGSVLNGADVKSITVTALPTTGIHAFTPLNGVPAGDTYSEKITTNPSTQYMGREVLYVPSIKYYPLTVNGTGSPGSIAPAKSTIPDASWTSLTHAPWVRINLY